MITYRKTPQLRIRRMTAAEPPYWCATLIFPYGSRRAAPVAIDYSDLVASAADRLEVSVAQDVRDELERIGTRQPFEGPVLIEASEVAEGVFRRGEQALEFLRMQRLPAVYLTSARGVLPENSAGATTVIATWPLDFARLENLCEEAAGRGTPWGLAVPVIYPVTTDLGALAALAALARKHEAEFLAAIQVEIDPTAKQALARSLTREGDDEAYDMLFHADLEPIHVATERHIAALAHESGMADFILPPGWPTPHNWNAAVLLTLTATRMLAMQHQIELAGTLARSARAVAELDKPLIRIAEAASLSIVETLDEVTVDILTEWLETGRSWFVQRVEERWRLRRDAGLASSVSDA